VEPVPGRELPFEVGKHVPRDLVRGPVGTGFAEDHPVGGQEDVGRRVVGGATDHHPVEPGIEEGHSLLERPHAAVHADVHVGKARLHLVDEPVVERRDLAVLPGAEPLQPGLAGMDRDPGDAGVADRARKSGRTSAGS
jgi:hypothetical protein